ASLEEVSDVHNKRYFERWFKMLTTSRFKGYYRYIANKYEARLADYNYSFYAMPGAEKDRCEVEHPGAVAGKIYCLGAHVNALAWRATLQSKWLIKRNLRAHLPKPLKAKIKHALGKPDVTVDEGTAKVS